MPLVPRHGPESFEDARIAELLNRYFVSIKVDREERPDVDSIYMAVCQAFTGSGGWPTSIFMTPYQKPFFAGTYFPRHSRSQMIGFEALLQVIHDMWKGTASGRERPGTYCRRNSCCGCNPP